MRRWLILLSWAAVVGCQAQKMDPEIKETMLQTIDLLMQTNSGRPLNIEVDDYLKIIKLSFEELEETFSRQVKDRNRRMVLRKLMDRGLRNIVREKEITRSCEPMQKQYVATLEEIKAELEKL